MYSNTPNVHEVDRLYKAYFKNNAFQKTTHTQNYKYWRRNIDEFVSPQGNIILPTREQFEAKIRQAKLKRTTTSRTGGWTNIGPFETYSQGSTTPRSIQANVYSMDQSELYPDVLVAGTESGGVFKSSNRGLNWHHIGWNIELSGGHTAIQMHPIDTNNILVRSNNNAYQSTDGGVTWASILYMGWNKSAYEIKFHPTQPDTIYVTGSAGLHRTYDVVYIIGRNTIYYYDANTSDWIQYDSGLSLDIKPLKARPFYRDGKLRLATYGRGIWETPLAEQNFTPVAQPITYADSIFCAKDTIQFDCYSILKHLGASWQWTFSPAPLYVSSATARNPSVVFGASGNYTIMLQVTNSNGASDSKTITDMVKVKDLCASDAMAGNALRFGASNNISEATQIMITDGGASFTETDARNYCEADTLPTTALTTSGSGDNHVKIANITKTVTHFTISAWIKPEGIQDNYASILMNDGMSAGFNFRGGNNTLGYHWPGGQYWWNSNLIVPVDEWSHVAMVVTPTSLTIYLNGEFATHNKTFSAVTFDILRIGSYKSWSDRNFEGEIDEVAIWKRALTTEEIRLMRHLTQDKIVGVDADLMAYYQFNETTETVFDKSGNQHHATFDGNATLTTSTAPVAGGNSQKMTITANGNHDFNTVGFEMNVPSGTTPNGDVIVSRLHYAPTDLPNSDTHLGYYWIVNNYGTNQTFTAIDNLKLKTRNGAVPMDFSDESITKRYFYSNS